MLCIAGKKRKVGTLKSGDIKAKKTAPAMKNASIMSFVVRGGPIVGDKKQSDILEKDSLPIDLPGKLENDSWNDDSDDEVKPLATMDDVKRRKLESGSDGEKVEQNNIGDKKVETPASQVDGNDIQTDDQETSKVDESDCKVGVEKMNDDISEAEMDVVEPPVTDKKSKELGMKDNAENMPSANEPAVSASSKLASFRFKPTIKK